MSKIAKLTPEQIEVATEWLMTYGTESIAQEVPIFFIMGFDDLFSRSADLKVTYYRNNRLRLRGKVLKALRMNHGAN